MMIELDYRDLNTAGEEFLFSLLAYMTGPCGVIVGMHCFRLWGII